MRRSCRLVVLSWVLVPALALGAPAAGAHTTAGDEGLDSRVRRLEERVEALQEKVFRTKARLATLEELVVGGDLATGAKVHVVHRNEMGGSYVLESATFALDGAAVFREVDEDGALDRRPVLEVFAGRVAAGRHQLAVKLVYRGKDATRFEVQSSFAFDARASQVTTVRIAGFEKGGFTTKLEDRPALRHDVEAAAEAPRAVPAAVNGAVGGGAR